MNYISIPLKRRNTHVKKFEKHGKKGMNYISIPSKRRNTHVKKFEKHEKKQ